MEGINKELKNKKTISFSVTKKLILVLSLSLPLIIISSIFMPSLTFIIFSIYNIIVLVLFILDYNITPSKNNIEIIMDKEIRLYYKSQNKVMIEVKNNSIKDLIIEMKLEIPSRHFDINNIDCKNNSLANSSYNFEFEITPNKRGSFPSDYIYIKITGVYGLCNKYYIYKNQIEYKVYPNLSDLSKYKLMVNKNMLTVQSEKRVARRGFGSDFESLREYVDGDDFKKINWLATARENKLIVNQFEQEKNNPIYIMIDSGRSLSYEINGYKKLDYAINASLILADIINQKGDNCGVITFDTKVNSFVMAKKGFTHRNYLMETLYHINDTKQTSNYSNAFTEFNNNQKRKSMIFLFTDFHTLEEARELIDAMSIISKRHMPVIILMKNELAEKRALSKNDENDINKVFLNGVSIDFIMERRKIIQAINNHGIICVESSADKFALSAVNNYIMLKNKLG